MAASGQVINLFEEYSKHAAVNCWYQGQGESVAMWDLYTKSEYGVAIKTSVKDLMRALSIYDKDVFVGTVEYRDHTALPLQTLAQTDLTPYKAILQKRICYQHECELRLVTHFLPDFPEDVEPGSLFTAPYPEHGRIVPVHLPTLIQSVTTGPHFPRWGWSLLHAALERAKIDAPIIESDAFKPPTARYIEG